MSTHMVEVPGLTFVAVIALALQAGIAVGSEIQLRKWERAARDAESSAEVGGGRG